MHELIREIFEAQQVTDEHDNVYPLHSAISRAEGEFLYSLIQQNDVQRALEIGCAFGISSLYICSALSQKQSAKHVIIDPYQMSTPWYGVGISNLKRAGFSFFELIQEPSEIALPALLKSEQHFDFAFIDGWHTFDHALVDFFYINRLLEVPGIVVFDDVDYPQLKKLVRYVSNYPCYELLGTLPNYYRLRDSIALKVSALLNRMPQRLTRQLLIDNAFRPDISLGLNTSIVALKKTEPDDRNWDWYAPF